MSNPTDGTPARAIKNRYGHVALELMRNSHQVDRVAANRVFQPGNEVNRALVQGVVQELLLPGSTIANAEALRELHNHAMSGASCLLLMEHYSNFDLPCLYVLVERLGEAYSAITASIISMAGMKLNEQSKFVLAFTESYTRLVIYPSRSLAALEQENRPGWQDERQKARSINMAALHEMVRRKHSGHLILLFPAGTRYRASDPTTKRGLPEVDSYIKSFDYIAMIGIAGNVLRLNPTNDMAMDEVYEDVVVLHVGPVLSARDFRAGIRAENPGLVGDAAKQAVSDGVMRHLDQLHRVAQSIRRPLLPADHPDRP